MITPITTMLSTTLHEHIVAQLLLADHTYDDFLQIVTQYCVINRGRSNEQPLRIDSYMEGGVEVYHLYIKLNTEIKADGLRSTQITEQPLGYYDIGIAVYTDKMNRQQNMLVMTPDLAECVCSIFNRRVFIQMQQELLRLRALIAQTNLPAMSPLTLTELNGTDAPATVVQASPMLQAHLACYTVQQAIDTFGDKGYDEDKLDATRDRHVEYPTSTVENGVAKDTYSTNVWQCAYRLNPTMWHKPVYSDTAIT